jgi:hypothetical protein
MFQDARIAFRGLLALFPLLVSFTFPAAAAPAGAVSDARASESYGRLPLHFEANQGQTHKDVRFLARGPGYGLYLTASEAVLALASPSPFAERDSCAGERHNTPAQEMPVAVRMSILNAAPKPLVNGLEELPGKANYFIGKDPSKWRTNMPTYAKVHYREVYPGIDLVYYGNQRQLEYDFVVAPGADPKKIVLGFKGADKLEIDAQGDLVLHTAGSTLRQKKPLIYQDIDGARRDIAGGYVLKPGSRVGFKVAEYDASRPLVIDPVLSYSTYLGGSDGEYGAGIAVDATGNVYVAGYTRSTDFPTTADAFQPAHTGGYNVAFVTKINPAGSALVYSTYLGGSNFEQAYGIAVDAEGSAYVTGRTSSWDFPTTAAAFQPAHTGGYNAAFVTKLNPTGSALVYSTYLGGSKSEYGYGIAVDTTGNAYVTGETHSTNFPTTPGAFQAAWGGDLAQCSSCPGCDSGPKCSADAFVTKLNPSGSALVYSTYLGGILIDMGRRIAVDAAGNAYVTGGTASDNFPTTPGAFQVTYGGFDDYFKYNVGDAFVTKLNPSGSALVYSTYLGGPARDSAGGIAVDADGNAYVTGSTSSLNFPTTPGAFQTSFSGGSFDAFVTKLDPSGSRLVYSTFLGGSVDDGAADIAVDKARNAYVTGSTTSTNFPTTERSFQATYGGGYYDAFVTKLDPGGSRLLYSTYLGGAASDFGGGIAVDTGGNVYVMGGTDSTNFSTTAGAFQSGFAGGSFDNPYDVFVAKFADATTRAEESATNQIGSWTSFGAETGTFSGGSMVASNVHASTATLSFTGTAVSWIGVKCRVCGIAIVAVDGAAPAMVNTAGPGASGSLSSEVVFSASGLAPGVTHTMVITVTGMTASGGAYIAMDAFDVTGGSATPPILASPLQPPIVPELPLLPPPPAAPSLPTVLGR